MKAASEMVSHALYLGLTIMAVTFLVIYINNTKSDMESKVVGSDMNYMSEYVKSNILDLYTISKNSENAEALIELQGRYEVELQNNKIILRDGSKAFEKNVNIPLVMSGNARLPASLKLTKLDGEYTIVISE